MCDSAMNGFIDTRNNVSDVLNQPTQTSRVDDVNEVTNLNPLGAVSEAFSLNIGTHAGGKLVPKLNTFIFEDFVQPRNGNSMRP